MSEKELYKQLEEYDKEVNKLFQENKKLKKELELEINSSNIKSAQIKDKKILIDKLKSRIDKAIEYNNHLIEHAKYHLNVNHIKKSNKILKGE